MGLPCQPHALPLPWSSRDGAPGTGAGRGGPAGSESGPKRALRCIREVQALQKGRRRGPRRTGGSPHPLWEAPGTQAPEDWPPVWGRARPPASHTAPPGGSGHLSPQQLQPAPSFPRAQPPRRGGCPASGSGRRPPSRGAAWCVCGGAPLGHSLLQEGCPPPPAPHQGPQPGPCSTWAGGEAAGQEGRLRGRWGGCGAGGEARPHPSAPGPRAPAGWGRGSRLPHGPPPPRRPGRPPPPGAAGLWKEGPRPPGPGGLTRRLRPRTGPRWVRLPGRRPRPPRSPVTASAPVPPAISGELAALRPPRAGGHGARSPRPAPRAPLPALPAPPGRPRPAHLPRATACAAPATYSSTAGTEGVSGRPRPPAPARRAPAPSCRPAA